MDVVFSVEMDKRRYTHWKTDTRTGAVPCFSSSRIRQARELQPAGCSFESHLPVYHKHLLFRFMEVPREETAVCKVQNMGRRTFRWISILDRIFQPSMSSSGLNWTAETGHTIPFGFGRVCATHRLASKSAAPATNLTVTDTSC